jgi:hypothetical protein
VRHAVARHVEEALHVAPRGENTVRASHYDHADVLVAAHLIEERRDLRAGLVRNDVESGAVEPQRRDALLGVNLQAQAIELAQEFASLLAVFIYRAFPFF